MVAERDHSTGEAPPAVAGLERRLRLRERSKALFGNRYRLEIALAIVRSGQVTNERLRQELDLPQSTVHKELSDLERLGLVARVPGTTGRTVYYRATPSRYWAFCQEFADGRGPR